MKVFPGFSQGGGAQMTSIPSEFFVNLLPIIDNLYELKITLFAIWVLEQQEGNLKYLRYQNFSEDDVLLSGLGKTRSESLDHLKEGLTKAIDRKTFLIAEGENNELEEAVFFINTPRGRAAQKGFLSGAWNPDERPNPGRQKIRPNIFRLYEENIGPLTPMISETLQEAEEMYPFNWIEQAIKIAVENNVRRWRYVEAILASWKERGRDEKDRRDTQEDPSRFLDGEFGQFFKTD